MKQRWIHVFAVRDGETDYRHENVVGPFDGILAALAHLAVWHGGDFVDDNLRFLVDTIHHGGIAWVTDVLGYSIERTPHE